MLSQTDQLLLEQLADQSLLTLVPFFKQTRFELFNFYLQGYRRVLASLEDSHTAALVTAFLEHLETFHHCYLDSAVRWDTA